jgi:hypothetical protein
MIEKRKPMRIHDPRARSLLWNHVALTVVLILCSRPGVAQAHADPTDRDQTDLAARIALMQKQLDATQQQLDAYRSALKSLQQEMAGGTANSQACNSNPVTDAVSLLQSVADLRE